MRNFRIRDLPYAVVWAGWILLLLAGCTGLAAERKPVVNAWAACEFYCSPYKVNLAVIDRDGGHLGCQCNIPPKRWQEEEPQGSWWPDQRRPSVLPAEWPFYNRKRRTV